MNNKMGIFEAETICALINAKTESAALAAREALSGKFSQDVFDIDKMILEARVQVEALLDFSDEDIETEGQEEIQDCIEGSKKKIQLYFCCNVFLSMLSKHVEHNKCPFLIQ